MNANTNTSIESKSADATGAAAPASVAASGGSPWAAALRRILRQPRFVLAAVLLGVCAAGLNGATQFMQLHFRKEAVLLPVKGLADEAEGIPARLGPWVQVTRDEPLDPEMEQYLGTRQYVIRQYVDSRLVPTVAADFKDLSKEDRLKRLAEIQSDFAKNPDGDPKVPVLTFQMTYYTGLVDTVAHIPDRCYVADGYDVIGQPDAITVPGVGFADGKKGAKTDVRFRFLNFEDTTGQGRVGRYVGYFFQVNGEYNESPIEVRKRLQQLLERYGYYSKIELMAQRIQPAKQEDEAYQHAYRRSVEKAMKDFVAAGLPQIEKRLPDWQALHAKAPAASAAAAAPGSTTGNTK